nr:hypothetical protein Iba_chr05cCG11090 [Ipomoea batatas]
MSIIGRGCRGLKWGVFQHWSFFPLSFAWISGGGSDELPVLISEGLFSARDISSPTSCFTPLSNIHFNSTPSCSGSPSPFLLATALISPTMSGVLFPGLWLGVGPSACGTYGQCFLQQLECRKIRKGWVASWAIVTSVKHHRNRIGLQRSCMPLLSSRNLASNSELIRFEHQLRFGNHPGVITAVVSQNCPSFPQDSGLPCCPVWFFKSVPIGAQEFAEHQL